MAARTRARLRSLLLAPGASWLGPQTSRADGIDWSAVAGALAPGVLALPHRQPYAGGELLLVAGAAFLCDRPFTAAGIETLAMQHRAPPALLAAWPCGDLPVVFFPREGAPWVSPAFWTWALGPGAWWGDVFVHADAPALVQQLRERAPAPAAGARLQPPALPFERVEAAEGELLRPKDPDTARMQLAVWRFAVREGLSPALYEELGHVARGLDVKESAQAAGRKINAIRMRRAELRTATGATSMLEVAARIHAPADVRLLSPRVRPSRKALPYHKPVKGPPGG